MHELPLHPQSNLTTLHVNTRTAPPTHITATTGTDGIELIPAALTSDTTLHKLFNTATDREFKYCSWTELPTLTDVHHYQASKATKWGTRYEYTLFVNDEPVGVTYLKTDDTNSCIFGLWLHNDYWGNEYSSLRADITIHLAFLIFQYDSIIVGCLNQNTNSRQAIEKYIRRYNGTYYGAPPVQQSTYNENLGYTPHHEYMITYNDFHSTQTGITCSIPGINDYATIPFSD